jgi:hypothetical protein
MKFKMLVVGMLCGAVLLGVMAAKYEVPNGSTVIVVDSAYSDAFDPCDPAFDNLYTPSSDWLVKHGNSERSLVLFNLSYARRRADMNFQLIGAMKDELKALKDPNDPNS